MKYLIWLGIVLLPFKGVSQLVSEGRFGINLGLTNYVTDSNLVFSKSGTGFMGGVTTSLQFSERFELFIEINISQHRMTFVGRETELSPPEDIKFKFEEVSVPFVINYKYLRLKDWDFGVNLGPSVHIGHNFVARDESKRYYFLDPLLVEAHYMEFDSRNENLSVNTFLVTGLNIEYNEALMASFRYYHGITDPYRKSPVYSPYVDISGKDSIFTFTLTYFFN